MERVLNAFLPGTLMIGLGLNRVGGRVKDEGQFPVPLE
jgi:hypothetical protein